MIRFAQRSDHPQLKALWAEAFGDPQETIDLYFAVRHADENMLVDVRDHTIAGMLSMLPVTLCGGDGCFYPARYLYAVATDARYRGRGISSALLEAAHAHIKSLGETAAVLVPASLGLFAFYTKRGYTPAFSLDIVTMPAAALPPFPRGGRIEPCTAADYTHIRDLAFQDSRLYVRWEESAVSYAIRSLAPTGGGAKISWNGGYGCALWDATDTGVLIREWALPIGDTETALSVLHSLLKANQYTVRLAQGTARGAVPQPFGMIHWLIPTPILPGNPPYLSLAMD